MDGQIVTAEEYEVEIKASLEAFERFKRKRFTADPLGLDYLSYEWLRADSQSKSLNAVCMAFGGMSREFARDAANHANKLVNVVIDLRVWSDIMEEILDDNVRFNLFHEFVSVKAHLGLAMPFAMREKFFFYFSHLSNQKRRIKDGPKADTLESDNRINQHVAYRYRDDWDRGREFLELVEFVAGSQMIENTMNFRNGFTHQVTPGIEWGITKVSSRKLVKAKAFEGMMADIPDPDAIRDLFIAPKKGEETAAIYGIGCQPPLKLKKVIEVLSEQVEHIHACFDMFKEFVWHIEDQLPELKQRQ